MGNTGLNRVGEALEAVHPGCNFVGLDPFPCHLQVLSRQRFLQQATGARLGFCRPCVRVFMQRTSGFVTGSLLPGYTVPPPCPPGLPRHLTHDLAVLHVPSHTLSFGPSLFWLRFISHRLELLRPLLTSRSGRTVGLSPTRRDLPRRTHSFIALPLHLRHLTFDTRALRFRAHSPYLATPSMRFLSIGSRHTLHASFPHSVTLMQLRFTSLTVTSSREDLHLQDCAHAGRTRKKARRSGLLKAVSRTDSSYFFRLRRRCSAPRPTKPRPIRAKESGSDTLNTALTSPVTRDRPVAASSVSN